jgi:hypothetical protein
VSYFAGALAIALVVSVAGNAWHYGQAVKARDELRQVKAEAQAEAGRRTMVVMEIVNASETKAETHRRDADAARAAVQRLRQQLAATAERAAAPAASASAPDAAPMLADMLGQCAERLRAMAEYADRAARAGQACEASYDALK